MDVIIDVLQLALLIGVIYKLIDWLFFLPAEIRKLVRAVSYLAAREHQREEKETADSFIDDD